MIVGLMGLNIFGRNLPTLLIAAVTAVLLIVVAFLVFQIFEGVGFDVDLEEPAAVVAERHP